MALRLAYLCNEYPALSHTFVSREVRALRRRGAEIVTFSIHRADPSRLLSDVDREEFASTEALLPPDPAAVARVQLALLRRSPGAYLRTLAFALGLGRGARGKLWQLFYFLEATLLWDGCRRHGLSHIHAHIATNAADVALLTARLGSEIDATDRSEEHTS